MEFLCGIINKKSSGINYTERIFSLNKKNFKSAEFFFRNKMESLLTLFFDYAWFKP